MLLEKGFGVFHNTSLCENTKGRIGIFGIETFRCRGDRGELQQECEGRNTKKMEGCNRRQRAQVQQTEDAVSVVRRRPQRRRDKSTRGGTGELRSLNIPSPSSWKRRTRKRTKMDELENSVKRVV